MNSTDHTGEAQHELDHTVHSKETLFKASLFAAVLAVLVLVIAILPSEYGVDPTGLGKALGLSKLSEASAVSVIPVVSEEIDGESADTYTIETQEGFVDIPVSAGKGLEYKFYLKKGHKLNYAWSAKGGELYFDFHGEPEGDTTGYFESHTISTSSNMRGTLTAPFTGSHGWYWENKTKKDVVVSLLTEGQYALIGFK